MSTQDKTDNTNTDSNSPAERVSASAPQAGSTKYHRRTNHSSSVETKKKKNIVVEIVSIPKADNSNAVEANRISWWSVRVNAGMFIVTFILAAFAFGQYISSKSAASIAQKTFEETKKYDSISLKRQQVYFDSNQARSEKNDRREEAIFNETNRKFIIENEPILNIFDVSINRVKSDSINVGYRIRNLASGVINVYKQGDTIIIKEYKYFDKFGKKREKELDKIKTRDETANITNVAQEIELSRKYTDAFRQIKNKSEVFIYYLGKIYYTSKYSPHNRVYRYIFRVFPVKGHSEWNWIYSENKDIK